jgi:DNA-binding response OmpR family regulator
VRGLTGAGPSFPPSFLLLIEKQREIAGEDETDAGREFQTRSSHICHVPVTRLSQHQHCRTGPRMVSQCGVRSKILVVDDEPEAVELVEFNLKQAGHDVVTAADGAEALKKARASLPDLIVLDIMLPEMNGLEVCKLLRRDAATAKIPIIMLTAKAAEIDRVLGLELGADDYITKPFSPRELVLRVKKMLQRDRAVTEEKDTFKFGDLLIDVPRHIVSWRGKAMDLTATEFKLLTVLAQRRGRVQSRDQLLRDVWEYHSVVDTRTVDTHMRRLREKLGPAAKYLDTVRGVGYRFVEN